MNLNTKKQSLEQGTFILLVASVTVKIIGALFKIPLSSNTVLGDLGFGYFSAAHDFISPFHTLAISGFPVAIAKVIADYSAKEKYNDVSNIFKLSRKMLAIFALLLAVVFFAVVFIIYAIRGKTSGSFYSFLVAIPSAVFCIIASSYRGAFEGKQQMVPVAVSNVIEALCKLVLGLTFAIVTIKVTSNLAFGAAAAMFGILTGSVFSYLYLHLHFKKSNLLPKSEKIADKQYQNELLKITLIISIPMVISSLSGSIVTFIDSITVRTQIAGLISQNYDSIVHKFSDIVTEVKGSTGVEITSDYLSTVLYGIRSKGYTMFNLVSMLTIAVGVGATPIVSENFVKKNYSELKENTVSVLKLSSLIAFPAGIGYFCLGGRIMTLLYGNSASSQLGGKILALYGITAIFAAVALPVGNVLLAINKRKEVLFNILVGFMAKILLNLWLCSFTKINIFGAVISTLVCYAIIFVLHISVLIKNVGKFIDFAAALFKPLIASIICGISAFVFSLLGKSNLITVFSIAVAGVVYLLFLIIFNVFSKTEILKLPFGKRILLVLNRLKSSKNS